MSVVFDLGNDIRWRGRKSIPLAVARRVRLDSQANSVIGKYFTEQRWEVDDAVGWWDMTGWTRDELRELERVVEWMCDHVAEATKDWTAEGLPWFHKDMPELRKRLQERLAM